MDAHNHPPPRQPPPPSLTRIGAGMPPHQDPPSWTADMSMADVNAVANMWGCQMGNGTDCPVNATIDGVVLDGSNPLCDKTIGDDAVSKLTHAASKRRSDGTPFFVAVGFRKPHLAFRFPRPWLEKYPSVDKIATAKHPVMDPSMPPVAARNPDLQVCMEK